MSWMTRMWVTCVSCPWQVPVLCNIQVSFTMNETMTAMSVDDVSDVGSGQPAFWSNLPPRSLWGDFNVPLNYLGFGGYKGQDEVMWRMAIILTQHFWPRSKFVCKLRCPKHPLFSQWESSNVACAQALAMADASRWISSLSPSAGSHLRTKFLPPYLPAYRPPGLVLGTYIAYPVWHWVSQVSAWEKERKIERKTCFHNLISDGEMATIASLQTWVPSHASAAASAGKKKPCVAANVPVSVVVSRLEASVSTESLWARSVFGRGKW